MYFDNITTAQELKKEYRRLSFKLHPDHNNGDDREFKSMLQEYQQRLRKLIIESGRTDEQISNGELSALIQMLFDWMKEYRPQMYRQFSDVLESPVTKVMLSVNVLPVSIVETIKKLTV
jgi:hypothetical protein